MANEQVTVDGSAACQRPGCGEECAALGRLQDMDAPEPWTTGRLDGWTAGWLDGWMAGWLDGWMAGWSTAVRTAEEITAQASFQSVLSWPQTSGRGWTGRLAAMCNVQCAVCSVLCTVY
jgi:hypothetical protein